MTSPRTLAFLLGLLLPLSLSLRADTIVMKSGERIDGKVLSNDGTEMKIAVTKKGMSLTTTVKTADVDHVETEEALAPARAEYKTRQAEIAALPNGFEKTVRSLELGRWARDQGIFAESVAAFRVCQDSLPDFDDVAEYEVARTQLAQKDFEACRKTVEKILDRNPKHQPARDLASDLAHDVKDEIVDDVKKGFEYYEQGNCRRALGVFERFVTSHSEREVELLSKECEEKTGKKLSSIMIDCRFRQGCPAPGCVSGWKRCPRPGCENGRIKEYHKRVEGPEGHAENEEITYTYCGQCFGIGQVICDRCKGTGFELGTPTEYEKKALVPVLVEQSRKMTDQAQRISSEMEKKVAPGGRAAEVAARVLDPMSILEHQRQARFFLETASRLAPALNSPGDEDLRGKLQEVDDTLFDAAIASSSYYMNESEKAFQEATDLQGIESGDIRLLESRLLAAKRAVAYAERARTYLNYVLKDCPGSASPRIGDAKRQLAEATELAKRCHAVEERLQKVEDRLVDLKPEDFRRAIRNIEWNLPGH